MRHEPRDHLPLSQLHTKPFKCTECDAGFGRKSNLIGHQRFARQLNTILHYLLGTFRIHRGERPFICDLCGRGFPIQSSLLTHKKQSHPEGSKPWDCEYCEHRFVSKSQLEIHTRVRPLGELFWTVMMLELLSKKVGKGDFGALLDKVKFKLHSGGSDDCPIIQVMFSWHIPFNCRYTPKRNPGYAILVAEGSLLSKTCLTIRDCTTTKWTSVALNVDNNLNGNSH